MISKGISKTIFYFEEIGRVNTNHTIKLVENYCAKYNIKKILIFSATLKSIFTLKSSLDKYNCKIYAVSFPYKQTFIASNGNGKKEFIPETSQENIKEKLQKANIELIQGILPFEDIIIPGIKDQKLEIINHTLSLFSRSLPLCIQAVLMACDGGYIEPGEKIISMSSDTAIVCRASSKRFMFHPTKGLDIMEIICKPYSSRILLNTKINGEV